MYFAVDNKGFITDVKGNDENIIFPSNEKVVGISASLFESNNNIKSVFIPKNIKTIGRKAFDNCSNLKKVKFDKNACISYIGDFAFSDTLIQNLSVDTIADTLVLGKYCFGYCKDLEQVEINAGKEIVVAPSCFYANPQLKSVCSSSSINISECCFGSCLQLETINFPNVNAIDDWAFSSCDNICNINVNKYCTKISKEAFSKTAQEKKLTSAFLFLS